MKIIHGYVYTENAGFVQKDIQIQGNLIASCGGVEGRSEKEEILDAKDCYVLPGLTDIHFHGCVGYDFCDGLIHVPYGLVSLEGEKLSTRGGNIIYAEDILKEAIERASNAINEKNPDLDDKETVAKMVGVGAVIFHDLFNQRIKNVEFSWSDVLSFEGTTGPYAQYTYARAKSILRKAEEAIYEGEINYDALADDVTYALLKCLNGYEDAIVSAAEKNEPSVVARYIISLATAFNKFYHEAPILQADEDTKTARLYVTNLVQTVLKEASGLLGMDCPEEM